MPFPLPPIVAVEGFPRPARETFPLTFYTLCAL